MSGTLVSPDGTPHPLARNTLIGRGDEVGIRVDTRGVSQVHALIRWRNERGGWWEIVDIASSNGTKVNGAPVDKVATLQAGATIAFGPHSGEWLLEDALPPGLHAVRLTDGFVVASSDGVLLIPHGDALVDVHECAPDRWMAWGAEGLPLHEGGLLLLDVPWRVHLPMQLGTIRERFALEDCTLHIYVDCGDYPTVFLETPGGRYALGKKAHWNEILALAKMRLTDDGEPHQRGWLENGILARRCFLDNARFVSEYTHRIRKAFAEFPVNLPGTIIEAQAGFTRIGEIGLVIYEE